MDFFEWALEIEEIYENIINKAKQQNIEEIKNFTKEIENEIENKLEKKQKLVQDILKVLVKEIDHLSNAFDKDISFVLDELKTRYEQNKIELIKNILKEIGIEF
ncbi:MAG: hypothetical protein ACP6IY_04855 [Promethearchaeia archaeon]